MALVILIIDDQKSLLVFIHSAKGGALSNPAFWRSAMFHLMIH
jgi:hypothetical protein